MPTVSLTSVLQNLQAARGHYTFKSPPRAKAFYCHQFSLASIDGALSTVVLNGLVPLLRLIITFYIVFVSITQITLHCFVRNWNDRLYTPKLPEVICCPTRLEVDKHVVKASIDLQRPNHGLSVHNPCLSDANL
ncbi:uncharacterized protein BDR25DRAFT_358101 [Lindgomyces ingoldianus]|uniref:Uncharacterized protein n=1 Tax=Lindgomyces ingoldianus TaxID=673940 RepID=A0ACB6QLH8_9PLEO|nr:uncharacterized protein BDR25DRAFT_358101 [Lindgomyces ingoldianus]KAF2467829.1 hypothetical protein BDR25DRAFT_358101 [Lindgomyces ingoldianus]